MKKIAVLPSLLTVGNAFCGFLAICYTADALAVAAGAGAGSAEAMVAFGAKIQIAAWLLFGSMVFDALDGKVARIANLTSDFGGQLDSLCDAISFGVAPAFLAKAYLDFDRVAQGLAPHPKLYFLAAVLFALCAILRLARFNVENEHGDDAHLYFRGLPTPAAAGVVASCVLLASGFSDSRIGQMLASSWPGVDWSVISRALLAILPFLLPILGLLMVSRVRYVHFVNHALRRRKPFPFLIQAIVILALAAIEIELALGLVFFGYALSGPLFGARPSARVAPAETLEGRQDL